MATPESIPSLGEFEKRIAYKTVPPSQIATQTANSMSLYFTRGEFPYPLDILRSFFSSDTLSFLYSAKKGFLANFYRLDQTHKISMEDMERLTHAAKPHLKKPDSQDREAFGYALVTFAAMPVIGKSEYLPDGFSQRGTMQPPSTVVDFFDRINELQVEIKKIVSGQTLPKTPIESSQSLWRTRVFFDVGKDLPMKFSENPKELEEVTRDAFETLLGDVKIDF